MVPFRWFLKALQLKNSADKSTVSNLCVQTTKAYFKDTNGLFRLKNPDQAYEADAAVTLAKGAIDAVT